MEDELDRLVLAAIGNAAGAMVEHLDGVRAQPGQRLSHYRILDRIGEGGMGMVCKAVDEKLDRVVALKLLLPLHTNSALGERVRREARATSALNHPSICTVFDFDEDAGHHFIVMEYLEGETLKARLKRTPVSEATAIEIGLAAAGALDAAHSKGLVHCDIKPANIFLTSRGDTKLLDFGIAQLVREEGGPTSEASASGTRGYMSPEQAAGQPLDHRTDVYSLGAVLREMVPRPSAALSKVIAQMTADVPDERLPSMAAVTLALRKAGARRRWPWVAVAATLLAVATGVGWAVWPRPPLVAERDWVLIGEIENRTGAPVFDGLLDDVVSVQIGQSPYLNVFAGARLNEQLALMRREPGTRLAPDVAREVSIRAGIPVFMTGAIVSVGTRYVISLDALAAATGDYLAREQAEASSQEDVLQAVGKAASTIRRRLGESTQSIDRFSVPVERATTSSLDALRAFQQAQDLMSLGTSAATRAIPFYLRAIELDPDFALAHSRLATAFESAREGKRAEQSAREAFRLRERVSERERYQIMARYYGQVSGEISLAIEALEMWSKAYPDDAAAHNSLSAYLKNVGQLERAAASSETAVRLLPASATYRANLAGAYLRLTQLDRARQVCADAVTAGLDNSTIHRFLHTIAFLEHDRAAMTREDAWRSQGTSDYANTEYRASLAGATGRLREARELYEQAVALAERQKLTDRAMQNRARLAVLEGYIGDPLQAVALARRVLSSDASRAVGADAAFALALARHPDGVDELARVMKDYPQDETYLRLWRPLLASVTALGAGRAAEAVPPLRLLQNGDRGDDAWLRPSYHLGLAYLAAGDGAAARQAFQRIVDQRGVVATSPLLALGHLGLGRAAALAGDPATAVTAYEQFLALWADADAGSELLRRARAEFAKLKAAN